MNDVTIGKACRMLRRRLGWRQLDLAERAGVSQSLISLVERGHLRKLGVATLRRIYGELDADVVIVATWRGGELDRLLDEGHAGIVGAVCRLLRDEGWQVLTEVTFSEYGERGSIDVLAWHEATRTLLVIEVKTEITSAEETLRRFDVKVRLAPRIAAQRLGVQAAAVARVLVVADGSANRRRLDRLEAVVGAAYPAGNREVRRWLRSPHGPLAGILFLPGARGRSVGTGGSRRVRRPRGEAVSP